jgi:BolA-like protein 1
VPLYSFFFFFLSTTLLSPGAYDDPNGSHVSIEVVSPEFEGKRPVQRQQLVYKAIWEELQGPVHAVDSMVCKTPAEASAA